LNYVFDSSEYFEEDNAPQNSNNNNLNNNYNNNNNNNYTISRTFTFDLNTDLGQIQPGDRCHACVSSDDLNPLKVNNVKKVVKKFNTPNPLSAR